MSRGLLPRLGASLRAQLLAWLLGPLTAVLALSLALAWLNARDTAADVFDDELLASARSIAEQVQVSGGVVEALVPPSAIERLGSAQRDRVVYRVDGPSGEQLAGYADVPVPTAPPGSDPLWLNSRFRTQAIRTVTIAQPLPGMDRPAIVTVGATTLARDALAAGLWRRTAAHEGVIVGLAALLVTVGLDRGLRPLARLMAAVEARDPRSLSRLSLRGVPTELRPLVGALNTAIGRIERQIEHRYQLIADTAHQLRTPLALMRTQAAVGLQGGCMQDKDEALAALSETASETSRLANQLLVLAAVEAAGAATAPGEVDLAQLSRSVLTSYAGRALQKTVSLSLEAGPGALMVRGAGQLLGELVGNLVDNALRYTPRGGAVMLLLAEGPGQAVLCVRDTGPGIPPALRERVFERFFRAPGNTEEGSGLGLAIVAEIARSHGGSVRLSEPPQGPGLMVEVSLPLHGPA